MKTILQLWLRLREEEQRKLLKQYVLILLFFCIAIFANAQTDTALRTSIKINLKDATNQEDIPFANVVAYQKGVQVAVAHTDMDGNCQINNLRPGVYSFKAAYIGYQAYEIKNVSLFANQVNRLNLKLKAGEYTLTTCCICYCYGDRSENWWPKLWTPYREWYAAYKEKRSAKQSAAPTKNKTEETIYFEEPIVLGDMGASEANKQKESNLSEKLALAYPNPSNGIVNIRVVDGVNDLRLMDANGKQVNYLKSDETHSKMEVTGLNDGVYYLHYQMKNEMRYEKIVVMNR